MGSSGSKTADALVIAANTLLQTTITQGIALLASKATTAAAERAVLTAIAKKYIKAAPSPASSRRRLQQASSSSGTVDLTNSTAVADLLTQAIATAQASGDITAASAASALSSVAAVAAAVANINSAVRLPHGQLANIVSCFSRARRAQIPGETFCALDVRHLSSSFAFAFPGVRLLGLRRGSRL